MLWERASYTTNFEKQVRGLYIYPTTQIHHRLLHSIIPPPEKPRPRELAEMREIARLPIDQLLHYLDDPLAEHFERQLEVLTLPLSIAYEGLRRASWNDMRRTRAAHAG